MLHDRTLPKERGATSPTKTLRGIAARHHSQSPARGGSRFTPKSLMVIAGLGIVAWVPIVAAAVLILY